MPIHSSPASTPLLLVLVAVMLIAGTWLLKRGRWPKRVGDTPHCPQCNYILTGLSGGNCPECGNAIQPERIVRGERYPRNSLTWLGGFLIAVGTALGIFVLTGAVDRIDWYQYRPSAWVIDDLDATAQADRDRAWAELQRRIASGSLSPVQQNRLTERALREQAGASSTSVTESMMTYLGQRWSDHALSAGQEQRFFAGCTRLVLTTRPKVGPKDDIPYIISADGRGPGMWYEKLDIGSYDVDGRKTRDGSSTTTCQLSGCTTGSTIIPQPIGHHQLRLKLNIQVGTGDQSGEIASVFHREERNLVAEFDVLPVQPPIAFIAAPDPPTISRCISPSDFRWQPNNYHDVDGMVDVHGAPVNVAFDLFARIGQKEYALGTLALEQGKQCGFGVSSGKLPGKPVKHFDLILRSSEAAARDTIGITQIWRGEVVIPNVAVK